MALATSADTSGEITETVCRGLSTQPIGSRRSWPPELMSPSPAPPSRTIDWGIGNYELTAAQLLPATRVVVDRAGLATGERVVDVGCGTGNAALLAAARGARVTGVDPARRLLEVARRLAAVQGLDATFKLGEAAALPIEDGDADVVLSVFGVIFAPNAPAAAAEMARVSGPSGRIILSAWVPEGAIHEAVRVAQEAVRRAIGTPSGPPPFAWHAPYALAELFAPDGFKVTVEEAHLAFTADSPRAYLEAESANHPLAVAGRAVLERHGEIQALRDKMFSIYEAANEAPEGFRVTSRYVVAIAERG